MKKKAAKKPTKLKTVARKPAPRRAATKPAAGKRATAAAPAAAARPEQRGVYTPQPIAGIGWAPFRYGS